MKRIDYMTVRSVKEKFCNKWLAGYGADAVFERRSLGWFVHFDGSFESLKFGDAKPDIERGDVIKVTFQKVPKWSQGPRSSQNISSAT